MVKEKCNYTNIYYLNEHLISNLVNIVREYLSTKFYYTESDAFRYITKRDSKTKNEKMSKKSK